MEACRHGELTGEVSRRLRRQGGEEVGAGWLREGRRSLGVCLRVPGRSEAAVASSTAAAEMWSRTETVLPATSHSGEGVIGFRVVQGG